MVLSQLQSGKCGKRKLLKELLKYQTQTSTELTEKRMPPIVGPTMYPTP